MRNNFQKFKKAPLIVSLIFLILSGVLFFFLRSRIDDNNQTAEDAATQWKIESTKRDEIKSLDRLLKAAESERAELDIHFIQSSDVVPFLDTLEKLATEVNSDAKVTQVDVALDNTSLSVGVNAEGSFEALYKFLRLLENSPYPLEITSMNLQRLDAGASLSGSTTTAAWSAVFKIKLLSYLQ